MLNTIKNIFNPKSNMDPNLKKIINKTFDYIPKKEVNYQQWINDYCNLLKMLDKVNFDELDNNEAELLKNDISNLHTLIR
ncbi:MAG: hypothetical protein EVA43_05975 [Flavobacteriales bacterium]|nr:MAG: hypothetical protein EVA43_05975 [Flavobacteriales bacterium]